MRIPLTAAVGIPAAAYILRAMLRGWDFSPDLPADAILGVALVVFVAVAWWLRRSSAADSAGDEPPADAHCEHRDERDRR